MVCWDHRKNCQLLLEQQLHCKNAADLKSKGWEFSISWRDRIREFDYGLTFNLYDSRTFITKYKNDTGLFYDRNEAQSAKRYRNGMEIGEIWGYVTDGFYTADDFNSDGSLKMEWFVSMVLRLM